MKVIVIGLGYVGLANALLLAQQNEVIGIDISEEKVNALNAGKSPIMDVEISRFLEEKELNFIASNDLEKHIKGTDFVVVAIPTDFNSELKSLDTSALEAVISKVRELEPSASIVVKSTIPIGFIERIRRRLQTKSVFFSPEFLREGSALHDNLFPSRIVIGDGSESAKKFASLLTSAALGKGFDCIFTEPSEAEAIKLFSNTYLAMRVAFINEIDNFAICENMNTEQIIRGISADPRIGEHYNNPSFGYGGYCLPKDSKQLLANFKNTPNDIINAVIKSNWTRKKFLARQIIKMKPDKVGVYKLSMKTGSDNFRENAVQDIVQILIQEGLEVIIYEPGCTEKFVSGAKIINDFKLFKNSSNVILANRMTDELKDVKYKVYTRDLFNAN